MGSPESATSLRVRYSEIDQMGTFYNSRALEWFECGRTAHLRSIGLPYTEIEERGVYLPIIEAYVRYRGRASYDDELHVMTRSEMSGNARVRFDMRIRHGHRGATIIEGHTIHACTNEAGKPIRPPNWFTTGIHGELPDPT